MADLKKSLIIAEGKSIFHKGRKISKEEINLLPSKTIDKLLKEKVLIENKK